MEHIGKVIFDIPFMIQSHAESIKKSWEPFKIYQLANPAIINNYVNWAGLAVLVSW